MSQGNRTSYDTKYGTRLPNNLSEAVEHLHDLCEEMHRMGNDPGQMEVRFDQGEDTHTGERFNRVIVYVKGES